MKIYALRADSSGCAHYRIVEPARAVSEQYGDVDITVDTSIEVRAWRNSKTGITTVEEVLTDADVIVVQRPLAQWFHSMIKQAHRQGIAVVVELDDDFENVHRQNAVWSNVQPSEHPESNYEWLKKSCEIADRVTVSTAELRRYAPHGRVSVIGNYIPRRDVSGEAIERRGQKPVRIGWSGTVQTHPTDLQVTKPAVNQVLRDTSSELIVIGDGVDVRDRLGIAKSISVRATGWVPTAQYMSTLCGSMDIGIVPLDGTKFNEAKSFLKGLEYAACGIPFVASDLPEYRRLYEEGIGEIARTPSDWRRCLSRLATNEELRIATGEAYNAVLREKFVLEQHAHRWVDAWEKAIDYQKGCTN